MLSAAEIYYSIGNKQILNGISAQFKPGEFNMILGPNGSGKSTFLKIFSGEVTDYTGEILYGNKLINTSKNADLAKFRAVMSQQPELNFPLTVDEVVMMGRYPHFNFNPGKKDYDICQDVMKRMQLLAFKDRNYLTLSGGEKQRVQFARVLAQIWEIPATGPRYLFLDEPLASLDIKYQQEFLQLAAEFCKAETVLIAIMHDINLATLYGDRLFFLKEGKLAAHGKPADILSAELIQEVFSVRVLLVADPASAKPIVVYARH